MKDPSKKDYDKVSCFLDSTYTVRCAMAYKGEKSRPSIQIWSPDSFDSLSSGCLCILRLHCCIIKQVVDRWRRNAELCCQKAAYIPATCGRTPWLDLQHCGGESVLLHIGWIPYGYGPCYHSATETSFSHATREFSLPVCPTKLVLEWTPEEHYVRNGWKSLVDYEDSILGLNLTTRTWAVGRRGWCQKGRLLRQETAAFLPANLDDEPLVDCQLPCTSTHYSAHCWHSNSTVLLSCFHSWAVTKQLLKRATIWVRFSFQRCFGMTLGSSAP